MSSPISNNKAVDCMGWQILALCLLCIFILSSFSASYFYITIKDFSGRLQSAFKPNPKKT